MVVIPEDVSALKRPALQKLCKKLGLKANGKNLDMISAIEEFKKARLLEESKALSQDLLLSSLDQAESRKDSSPEVWTTPPTSPNTATAAKKRGKKRKKKSAKKDASEGVENHTESSVIKKSTSSPLPSNPPEKLSPLASDRLVRKRKRRDTYSISPNNSLLCQSGTAKHPRLDITETPVDLQKNSDISSESSAKDGTPKEVAPFSPPSNSDQPRSNTKRKRKSTYTIRSSSAAENTPLKDKAPFSPPSDSDQPRSSTKRKRKSTYTIRSSSAVDNTPLKDKAPFSPLSDSDQPRSSTKRKRKSSYTIISSESFEDLQVKPAKDEDAPQAKRARRSTYDVTPEDSILLGADLTLKNGITELVNQEMESGIGSIIGGQEPVSGTESNTSITESGIELDIREDMVAGGESNHKNEILSLLEQRVEERKADPNYVPKFSSAASNTRIPVKSAIAKKFDKAHEKNFSRMKSIASCYQDRINRTTSLSKNSGKKRVSLTSLARAKLRASPSASLVKSSGVDGKRRTTVHVGKKLPPNHSTMSKGFNPTVINTKSATFNFGKAVTFKGTALKTKSNQVTVSSAISTSESSNQKTSSKKSMSVMKTPSKPFASTGENNPSAAKRKTFDLQASLKKSKPKYKTYKGKLPQVNMPSF